MNSSTRSDMDYDYPRKDIKPVHNGNKYDPLSNYSTPKPNASNHYASPISSLYNYRANSPVSYSPTFNNNNINNNNEPRSFTSLETVVPLPNIKLNMPNGVYYDVPKNIPVNPIFACQTPTTAVVTAKFPIPNDSPLNNKPKLPQKSSAVLNKMSSYPGGPIELNLNALNIQNNNTVDVNYMNRVQTLTKQSTSKPLPPLPGGGISNQKILTKIDLPQSNRPPLMPASKFQSKNNNNNINDDDDDDDEDCDYDYDYVCLESKKKLDDEDENVKKLISRDLQQRYEHLALNSSGFLDLQNLEKSLQSKSMISPNVKAQFLLSYRHFLSISLKNFESWTKLNLEVIERSPPPSVYINFTKHILLSGQNLLLVAKSLNRHFGQIESLNTFADTFYDYLRQIVVKTKKCAASIPTNKKFTNEMIESINSALQYANNLNADFTKHMHSL